MTNRELTRIEIDILVDEQVAAGHSNHCAIQQILGGKSCICEKGEEEKDGREE